MSSDLSSDSSSSDSDSSSSSSSSDSSSEYSSSSEEEVLPSFLVEEEEEESEEGEEKKVREGFASRPAKGNRPMKIKNSWKLMTPDEKNDLSVKYNFTFATENILQFGSWEVVEAFLKDIRHIYQLPPKCLLMYKGEYNQLTNFGKNLRSYERKKRDLLEREDVFEHRKTLYMYSGEYRCYKTKGCPVGENLRRDVKQDGPLEASVFPHPLDFVLAYSAIESRKYDDLIRYYRKSDLSFDNLMIPRSRPLRSYQPTLKGSQYNKTIFGAGLYNKWFYISLDKPICDQRSLGILVRVTRTFEVDTYNNHIFPELWALVIIKNFGTSERLNNREGFSFFFLHHDDEFQENNMLGGPRDRRCGGRAGMADEEEEQPNEDRNVDASAERFKEVIQVRNPKFIDRGMIDEGQRQEPRFILQDKWKNLKWDDRTSQITSTFDQIAEFIQKKIVFPHVTYDPQNTGNDFTADGGLGKRMNELGFRLQPRSQFPLNTAREIITEDLKSLSFLMYNSTIIYERSIGTHDSEILKRRINYKQWNYRQLCHLHSFMGQTSPVVRNLRIGFNVYNFVYKFTSGRLVGNDFGIRDQDLVLEDPGDG